MVMPNDFWARILGGSPMSNEERSKLALVEALQSPFITPTEDFLPNPLKWGAKGAGLAGKEALGLVPLVVGGIKKITKEMIERGNKIMPPTGTIIGDESLPLYRFVSGETIKKGEEYGIHWTHSLKDIEQMASEEPGFIITAKHPGAKHVMDWENKNDLPIMERAIGGYEYRHNVFPEVPIRPGTKIDVLKIEKVTADGKRIKVGIK